MTVRVYRSTDGSAPVLTGQVGALIALLDACLVTGYGSKAAAGWTKPYLDTNIAVYRTGTGSRQRYMRVDDRDINSSRIHGFENMTSVSDFSSQFTLGLGIPANDPNPLTATGIYILKSITTDATVRAWVIVATETVMYMFLEPGADNTWTPWPSSGTSGRGQMFFGDFISYKPNDVYNTAIIGQTSSIDSGRLGEGSSGISAPATGHYLVRGYLGYGPAQFNKALSSGYYGISFGASTGGALFPDLLSGGIVLSSIEMVEIMEPAATAYKFITRGKMPGVYSCINNLPLTQGDVIQGTGSLNGKTFLTVEVWNSGSNRRMFVEISDTW